MQNDIPKKLKYEKKFRLYVMVDTSFDLKMLNLGAPMMKIFIFELLSIWSKLEQLL